MAKSERQRQKAAEKRKRRAKEKKALRPPDSRTIWMKCLHDVTTLSNHSGNIVKLLKEGLSEKEAAQQLGIKPEEVAAVHTAFNRLPHAIKDIAIRYPGALENPKFCEGLLEATKRLKRNKHGDVDYSSSDLTHLHSLLQQGREQIRTEEI